MSIQSKAAVIVDKGKVEVKTITIPEPKQGEVLVRQKAAALCTLEQRFFTGVFPVYPGVWGHEVSGIVEAIGPNTYTPLKVGDHVARGCGSACDECYFCAIGQDAKCEVEKMRLKAQQKSDREDGIMGIFGLSEYSVVDPRNLVQISKEIPFEQAALSEPVACAVSSANKLDIQLGQTVVVIGAGAMGIANILVSKYQGAFVVASELDEQRRQKALNAGAHAVLNPNLGDIGQQLKDINEGRLADVVIVTIGLEQANKQAMELVAPNGKVMLFASAHPAVPLSIDPNVIHRSGITITGSTSKNRKDLYQASLLIGKKIISVETMIEKVFPLEQAQLAFEMAIQPQNYRIVLSM
ncbi:MAG: zinc-binding dehydrogenase [Firmicutes bacterium]|nr:zinc-binding dehydrogenase [Bacillota bacterium]